MQLKGKEMWDWVRKTLEMYLNRQRCLFQKIRQLNISMYYSFIKSAYTCHLSHACCCFQTSFYLTCFDLSYWQIHLNCLMHLDHVLSCHFISMTCCQRVGLGTGMGKPVVIPKQVIQVWCLVLAHCGIPCTRTAVSQVCMGIIIRWE